MDARDHRPRGKQSADGRSSRRAVQGWRAQHARGVLRHMETKLGRGKGSEPTHGVLSGQFDFLQRWERGKRGFGGSRGNRVNVGQQRVRFFADEQMGDLGREAGVLAARLKRFRLARRLSLRQLGERVPPNTQQLDLGGRRSEFRVTSVA